jgi:hypothetical protein
MSKYSLKNEFYIESTSHLKISNHCYSGRVKDVGVYSRGSRFLFFLIFNFLQFAIDGKNNSKTKEDKLFIFIFMSSYAEMSFVT